SVVIHCSFYRPDNLRVKRVVWGHVKSRHVSGRVIFDSNVRRATTRYQYTGDKYHSCSLKIHKVLQNDAGKYIITFNSFKMDTWRGNAGPTLKVVDLKVLVTKTNGNETMKEGDFVNLTCLNRCDARDPASAFTWFKNGEPINEGPALYLSNISPANSGNYTCSLKTQAGTSSGVMHIDVEYGPKNTTVSVSSSGADTDSNITLVCSSHSNPPVANYTWFKIDADIVEVGHQPIFIPGDRGQYLCSVTNKHGSQNSSTVNLKTECKCSHTVPVVLPVCGAIKLLLFQTILDSIYQRYSYHCYCRCCCFAVECDNCNCCPKVSCIYFISSFNERVDVAL
uniref:Ig-like domain-containing protein n=1 Tax=Anabas testudineus TaxID=64144 RepID=A0A3Q1JJE4_ANATE